MTSVYGTKLTDKEYQSAITSLIQIVPTNLSPEDDDVWAMVELAIMAYHRFGRDFPDHKLGPLLKAKKQVDKYRFLFPLIGLKGGAWIAKRIYTKHLGKEDAEAFLRY